jgi:hypothetical protein
MMLDPTTPPPRVWSWNARRRADQRTILLFFFLLARHGRPKGSLECSISIASLDRFERSISKRLGRFEFWRGAIDRSPTYTYIKAHHKARRDRFGRDIEEVKGLVGLLPNMITISYDWTKLNSPETKWFYFQIDRWLKEHIGLIRKRFGSCGMKTYFIMVFCMGALYCSLYTYWHKLIGTANGF